MAPNRISAIAKGETGVAESVEFSTDGESSVLALSRRIHADVYGIIRRQRVPGVTVVDKTDDVCIRIAR